MCRKKLSFIYFANKKPERENSGHRRRHCRRQPLLKTMLPIYSVHVVGRPPVTIQVILSRRWMAGRSYNSQENIEIPLNPFQSLPAVDTEL